MSAPTQIQISDMASVVGGGAQQSNGAFSMEQRLIINTRYFRLWMQRGGSFQSVQAMPSTYSPAIKSGNC